MPLKYLNLTPHLMVHHAVTAGMGVGSSRSLIAVDGLTEKTLAVPFGPVLPQTATYNLVYPSHLERRRDIVAFRNWALAEAEASTKKLAPLLKGVATGSPDGTTKRPRCRRRTCRRHSEMLAAILLRDNTIDCQRPRGHAR